MRDKARKDDKKKLGVENCRKLRVAGFKKSLSQNPKWILGQCTEI